MAIDINAVNLAILAAATATVGAVVQQAVTSRAKTNEELRDKRLEAYPALWKLTSVVPRWPREELTVRTAADFHIALRAWYYGPGGMFLSENARARYGEVQELLAVQLLAAPAAGDVVLPASAYNRVRDACSALRTAITEDLETRRARSVWWAAVRGVRHWRQRVRARRRLRGVNAPER
jgi:hypothetical protein